LGAAAAVLLLLFLFFPQQYPGDRLTADQLYEKHYQPLSLNTTSRGDSEVPEGLSYYQEGDYEKAIPYLQTLKEKGEYKLAPVYLGISYMETDQDAKAKKTFQTLLTGDSDPFQRQHAYWFLTMLQLKKKNIAETRQRLKIIIDQKGIYLQEATELLEDTEVSGKD
ncbi:MAG: tetratricopeptide repeat protein, partial [Cyclobacteriaceae bacterium]